MPNPSLRPKALLLDGHSRAAPEVALSLGRAGLDVHVASADPDPLARHAARVTRHIPQPPRGQPGNFAAWLRELDAREGYRLVVPTSDDSLLGVAELDEDDDLRRRAVIAGDSPLHAAMDKQATWELARAVGVAVPTNVLHRRGEDPAPPRALPAVLKPQSSMNRTAGGDRKLFVEIARSGRERADMLARMLRLSSVQEQEYVAGTGVGVECLYAHGALAWAFVHERLHELPLTGGGSSYRRSLALDERLLAPAVALLDRLAWHGVAMVEFKRTPDGRLVLMEINPRLWGSLALPIDCGVDFPRGLLALAEGRPLPSQPTYRVGHRSRHVEADLAWMKANLRADHDDPLLLTRPVGRSAMEWLRPLGGGESWDYVDRSDLRLGLRMLGRVLRAEWHAWKSRAARARLRRTALRRHAGVAARAAGAARVTFLCHGNICRSPFAEALCAQMLGAARVGSSGTHPQPGRSTPERIIEAARVHGVDLAAHRSRVFDPAALRPGELLLVMDLDNYAWVARHAPALLPATTLLGLFGDPAEVEVPDPYALEGERVERVMRQIALATRRLAGVLASRDADAERAGAAAGEAR
ncbi:MAG: ATP-grasp domain-containing protein [Xanthomonadales bacterium]|nr:ATP-grasp domain-containing protein [Xanthomonadales bacterium]